MNSAESALGLRLTNPNEPLPMALTPKDVSRIATLARLELSAGEQQELLAQLNGFFGIVEQMRAVDTAGVTPLYTPLSAVDIFVKDLGLVLDTARATKFPLPLASTAHQMFMQASSAGFGREDDAAVIKIFPGIKLPERGTK